MKYKSISTSNTDAYRAGSEIGEGLHDLYPEVVLLFASITFCNDFSDFFCGLYDGLGTRDVLVFGGTGDGIYATDLTAHYGVCALGISSDARVKWSAAVETGVGADSARAARSCAANALAEASGPVKWAFVLADGVKSDGSGIVAGIRSVLDIPFVGGLTGDDRKFSSSRIFLNGRELEDGVAVLLASGDLPFMANAASGWTPFGAAGIVEECRGCTVTKISGQTPQTFIKEQIGKPLAEADLAMTALAVYHKSNDESFCLRTFSQFDAASGAITTFARIDQGAVAKVCGASREQVLHGVSAALEGIVRRGFKAEAAIIISCVGRKWLLDDCGHQEVELVKSALGRHIPLVGFPSFGEISPFMLDDGEYSDSLFHNVTLVVCLLGA